MNATFTLMLTVLYYNGPGWHSRYSDSLRAGWSGDRIPVGARFSAPVQTGPGAHLASCTMGTGSFAGVKRPGRGADHPPHLSAEVKKEWSYTSTPPLGLYGLLWEHLTVLQHVYGNWPRKGNWWNYQKKNLDSPNCEYRRVETVGWLE